MDFNLYETLQLKASCEAKEIRAAYRRLVLLHHPDRSNDPKSAALFIRITEAYEVLKDPIRRQNYDTILRQRAERKRPVQTAQAAKPAHTPPPRPTGAEAARLAVFFRQGRYTDAENLAHQLLKRDDRLAVAYAVLGDIARQRGQIREAAKMYAYALQMDPRNDLYLRKNEEIAVSPGASTPV